MAGRPEKRTADYFPFFVKDGRTLFVLETQFGATGTGVFTNVLRFLCSTPDHHYSIKNQSDRLFFFSKLRVDESKGMEMLALMVKTGKLDEELFNHQIIYCPDLIESIQEAYRKRGNQIITRDGVLQFYGLPTEEKQLTAEEIELARIQGGDNTQRRKEKKRKEEEKVSLDDETWLKTLEENPVYRGIEVRVLHGKMLVWCETHGKKPTRRRFVNWLNHEDKPMNGKVVQPTPAAHQPVKTEKCPTCGNVVMKGLLTDDGHCEKCLPRRPRPHVDYNELVKVAGAVKGVA